MKERKNVNLYSVMAAGLVGLVLGALVGGIAGRLAMRIVAVVGGIQPAFSVEGTAGIMVIAGFLGLIAGLIYGVVRPFIPVRGLWKGLVFGLILAALIALPFFLAPEGEFGLASPVVGATLFGAIGLAFALALEAGLLHHDGSVAVSKQHPVALIWLIPFAFFLALALAGMFSLADEFTRFPPAASDWYLALGLNFQSAHQLHGLAMVAFATLYCGLASVVFWQSAGNRAGSLAALALVVLAAGWFRAEPLTAGVMTRLPLVRSLPALVRAGGLALIVLTMVVWPDGRLEPGWTKVAFVVWCLWLAAWLATPLRNVLPEWAPLVLAAAFYASGLVSLALRSRRVSSQRRQIAPLLVGFGLAGALVLALWVAALVQPGLRVRDVLLPETLFVFLPYLLPWLLLPVSLLLGLRAASRSAVVAPASHATTQPAKALS